ncbi:MAG: transglutaminase TgpA family protein [Planctomycetota bacterium]|jgi:transglutaminase-like putative cysteine protease
MKFYSAFRFSMHLTVLVGMMAIIMGELTTGAALPVLAVIGLAVYIVLSIRAGKSEKPLLTSQQVNWATIFLFFVMFADRILLSPEWTLAFAHFLLLVQVLKLTTERRDRDYAQMFAISLIHLGVAGALTEDMTFAPTFVMYMISSTWTLLLFHLKRVAEAEVAGATGGVSAPRRMVTGGKKSAANALTAPGKAEFPPRFISGKFFAASAGLSMVTLVFTIILFLVFPRTGLGFMSSFGRNRNKTGISDSVNLGKTGRISESDVQIARVRTLQGKGYLAEKLWRAYIFPYYDGKIWHRSFPNRKLRGISESYNSNRIYNNECEDPWVAKANTTCRWFRRTNSTGTRLEQVFQILPGAFSLNNTTIPVIGAGDIAEIDFYGSVRNLSVPSVVHYDLSGSVRRYICTAEQRYVVRTILPSQNPEELRKAVCSGRGIAEDYAKLPADRVENGPQWETRLRNLATQWITEAGAKTDFEKVKAIEHALFSRFEYTLDFQRDVENEEPIADFLFNRKKGHCELFASAMVLLCRSIGLPARLVTGFKAGRWNNLGGYNIIRAKDSHAWVEVHFQKPGGWPFQKPIGWVSFDPTPGSTEDDGTIGLFAGIIDYLSVKWRTHVIAFSLSDQARFVIRMRSQYSRMRLWFKAKVAALKKWLSFDGGGKRRVSKYVIYGLIIACMAGLAVFIYLKNRRKLVAGIAGNAGPSRIRFYEELITRLGRAGYRRKASETPLEFARNVLAEGGMALSPVEKLTLLYLGVRFGERMLSPADKSLIENERAKLDGALKEKKKPGN